MPRLLLLCLLFLALLPVDHALAFTDEAQLAIAQETESIGKAKGLARRDGDVLTLRTGGGDVTFRDEHMCGEDGGPFEWAHCVRYVFVEYIARHNAFLVMWLPDEDHGYEWVDAETGKVIHFGDRPQFSPSGKRFAVVASNMMARSGSIEIWVHKGGTFAREWRIEPEAYCYFTRWQNEDTILMTASYGYIPPDEQPARLTKKNGRWTLHLPAETPRP